MVTTRRSAENSTFDSASSKGGVGLLERPIAAKEKIVETPSVEKTNAEASERMQRNLYKLMNYDRFSEQAMQTDEEEKTVTKDFSDEDIRPTSTTMQFGDDNIDQIREEMNRKEEVEEISYRLNGKGKVAVVMYSLIVAVILALIVLNTGLLSSLSAQSSAAYADYQAVVGEYNSVMSEIDSISSPDYIVDKAEELGMSK